MSLNFEIEKVFDLIVRRWPWLVALGIFGALLGFGFSMLFPPIYQAQAVMAVGLDFDRDPPIDQREQDRAESKISALIQSDDVLQGVLDELNQGAEWKNNLPDLEEFISISELRRIQSHWHLLVNHANPDLAASLANEWITISEESLWEAYVHANEAIQLQQHVAKILTELIELEIENGMNEELEDQIARLEHKATLLEEQKIEEIRLSKGVVTSLTFHMSNMAPVPEEPVTRARGDLIVAGCLLGVLTGIIIIFFKVILDEAQAGDHKS